MPEPIIRILGIYIMTPETISKAYLKKKTLKSVIPTLQPLKLLRQ
jgi:hypothetical protein